MDYSSLSDGELMALVVAGDHAAFATLVGRHGQRFFALAYRSLQQQADAEDVVQTAFIKLWQKPQYWDSSKGLFTTWFYRLIVNACHDLRRKRNHMADVDDQFAEPHIETVPSEQSSLEQQQHDQRQRHFVELAVRRLPASQRDAINLVVYTELPQKQAAEIMGLSLKALESLLVRAKKSMAKTVSELNDEIEVSASNNQSAGKL